ncbi:alpha-amylase family protein [Nocardioides pocheonensis]|uniref:Glycosidase n=1 Tax=Nocardioides pocheonensis TaxID=661485 RepID=A0A3N0GQT3_9ACTN|nr:alpha-amylase family protein [Nocardioides pocheonensis]RNM14787.1 glycosidase [Nocardioides pocheonensis]
MQPLWYRNAVIYQVDVAFFLDSDGDGWGDLRGVTERLEHIRGLGASCIWLLPFYQSPYDDGGYDVTDHLAVDPRFGDVADLAMLLNKAESLGLRVIVDLVPQHTSIQHRWFQEARRDRTSPYRDYYVWADEPHDTDVEPVFPTVEDSVWTWDDEAQQFYRHVFYDFEPDLELGNPKVREEIRRIMAFWLRMGVSGFRIDAVPYMVERARAADPRDDGYWLLAELREFAALHHPDAVLLGEVDVPPEKYADYIGPPDRLSMLIDFWLNNNTFLSLAREKSEPLARAIARRPTPHRHGQYATFLRNHDELDLEQLGTEDRAEVLDRFAPKDEMRVYDRGIRRRLAPMLDGDTRRIAMAHALLMSLPGTPVLLYGDEIGMGEDLSRPERKAVRTVMQWTDAENGGFSLAPADRLAAAPISGGRFGYERVNVAAQACNRESLMAQVSHLTRTRLGAEEIGAGTCTVLETGVPSVLCLCHELDGRHLVAAVNLAGEDVTCELADVRLSGLVDVLSDREYPPPGDDPVKFVLGGHGYRWLRRREDPFSDALHPEGD